jgi:threonine dehydrogenase-like Zn-dependent dehydrogenase
MLGKVNLDLLGIIQKDEKKLSDRKEALAIKEQKVKELIKDKNKFFKDVAKIISADISRVSARNYNKNNAEEAFDKLESKKVLSQELIEEHRTTLEQQEKQQLTPIETTTTKALEGIINDSKNILNKTVENVVIDRLKNL